MTCGAWLRRASLPRGSFRSYLIFGLALILLDPTRVAFGQTDEESVRDDEGSKISTEDVVEVRGNRTLWDVAGFSYEERLLFTGESLGKIFEGRPQFWVERTGSSEMQTRLYVDGLGPERMRWTLNGHPMSDLSVVGWQLSDIPVDWVGRVITRASGSSENGLGGFQPALNVFTRPFELERAVDARIGAGLPREHHVGAGFSDPSVGRLNVGHLSRFGGREIYDDQGTWYDRNDDRFAQFETERSGRESAIYESAWRSDTEGLELQVVGFYLRDYRRGPASIRSDSIRVESERDGIFTGLILSNEPADSLIWQIGANAFAARRNVVRVDKDDNQLSTLDDRYQRLNLWAEVSSRLEATTLTLEGRGSLAKRSPAVGDSFSESWLRGSWLYRWSQGLVLGCSVEAIAAEKPDGSWIARPMGDCGFEADWGTLSLSGTAGYALRRPTWVEWFGDGADLLANESLEPEWGLSSALELQWQPSATWLFILDGKLRYGEDWIAWIPSSFATRKALNLGEYRQAVAGVSTRWQPTSSLEFLSSLRISWARERTRGGNWMKIPQDLPLRALGKGVWRPISSLALEVSGDCLGPRALDRQNLVTASPRLLIHGGVLWELSEGAVVSMRGRNLLNRMATTGTSPTGDVLDIAEMSVLGFPVNGREIMLNLSLKGLEDL